jgi:hypothetical protein
MILVIQNPRVTIGTLFNGSDTGFEDEGGMARSARRGAARRMVCC